jgi:hypothetical protein
MVALYSPATLSSRNAKYCARGTDGKPDLRELHHKNSVYRCQSSEVRFSAGGMVAARWAVIFSTISSMRGSRGGRPVDAIIEISVSESTSRGCYIRSGGSKAMEIAVLGSGNVGGALGTHWAKAGHDVVFASRNPGSAEMTKLVAEAGAKARAATVAEAAEGAAVVLLASPWGAAESIIAQCGGLAGKIELNATNPLGEGMNSHAGTDRAANRCNVGRRGAW